MPGTPRLTVTPYSPTQLLRGREPVAGSERAVEDLRTDFVRDPPVDRSG